MNEQFMPAFFSEFQETSFKLQRENIRSHLQFKSAAKVLFSFSCTMRES